MYVCKAQTNICLLNKLIVLFSVVFFAPFLEWEELAHMQNLNLKKFHIFKKIELGKIERAQVIPRTWFHSFFSRKKSEIQIAFTFFEKWKVKNKFLSLFFESWKWNSNGSRSRTRSENLKKISRILEKRESRWGLEFVLLLVAYWWINLVNLHITKETTLFVKMIDLQIFDLIFLFANHQRNYFKR